MAKTRISLSIDTKLLKQIDRESSRFFSKNRSQTIEKMIEEYLSISYPCIILAGGDPKNQLIEGTNTYRPLADIGGLTLIEDIIAKVHLAGHENIIIVGSSEINTEIFKKLGDGKENGLSIRYIEEKEHKGNAHTLSIIKHLIKQPFLLVPCDHFFTFDLSNLRKSHDQNNCTITLAIYAGISESPIGSIVEIDCGKITNYINKPKNLLTHMNPTGVAYIEPEIKNLLTEKNNSLEQDVYPRLVKSNNLYGSIISGEFINLHTPKELASIRKIRK